MLTALTLLLFCQLAGELASRSLALPIPGPVLGLVLLAAGLMLHQRQRGKDGQPVESTDLGRTATQLLAVLGVLFVPAGVGVVQQLHLLGTHGPAIFAALLGSTVLTLLVTVGVFRLVRRLQGRRSRTTEGQEDKP